MLHVVVWLFGAIGFLVTGMVLYHYLVLVASSVVRALVGDCLEDGWWPKESKCRRFVEAIKNRYLGYHYGFCWFERQETRKYGWTSVKRVKYFKTWQARTEFIKKHRIDEIIRFYEPEED